MNAQLKTDLNISVFMQKLISVNGAKVIAVEVNRLGKLAHFLRFRGGNLFRTSLTN